MNLSTNPSSDGDAHRTGPLIRLPATLALVGLGRSAWLDLVAKGKAPRPIKIGRAALWHEPEVRAFIADRIRQSRGHAKSEDAQ